MKRKISIILFFCILWNAMFITVFPTETKAAKSKPSISAESAVVMDVQSGSILYSKNMDKRQYPASITKIMTGLIALENSSLSETVTYSGSAVLNLESGASNIGIKVGERMTMEESLYAILLMSANEACNGVAEHIAGSVKNYAKMMNSRAKELGCTGTHFANPNGLWLKNHYTTAHDMALIARAAYKNSTFAQIVGTKRYNIPKTNKNKAGHALYNHHGMLYANPSYPQYVYEYCVGGKTGYTLKCRYTLVTYAKKNGMTLVSVIMKAPNHPSMEPNEYTDSTKLLNYCFENYTRYGIQDNTTNEINNQYLFTKFSPYYKQSTSSLSLDADAGVILPKGVSLNRAQRKVEFYDTPQTGKDGRNVIGTVTYTYNNKKVGGSDIYYTEKQLPMLSDSIDMSQWFDAAVEKANEEPFPWKKVAIITILVLATGAAVVLIILRIQAQKEQRSRRNRYKRTRRRLRRGRNDRNLYFKR
ncbi:MAG: D-alanyl-D-alanine carboxypeptidase [Lachnospiraceae bacterium]|nr:D-alanyl-D-alanine carboxypeptidase [Lachnospiraceae bacterium]